MVIVNYEVYVLEQSRGWMLHARFPRQERETALAEAKELEKTLRVRVKVVRETYYTDDNLFEEAEVYVSGGGASGAAKPAVRKAAPAGARNPQPPRQRAAPQTDQPRKAPRAKPSRPKPAPSKDAAPARPQHKKATKARHLVGRLMAIMAASMAVAFGAIKVTPSIIMFLWEVGFQLRISPSAYGQLLFAIFVLTFLAVAVPLALRFLPRQTEIPVMRRPHWTSSPKQDKALKDSLDKLASKALSEAPPIPDPPTEEEAEAIPEPKPDDLPEILPGPEDDALPPILPGPEDESVPAPAAVKAEADGAPTVSIESHQPTVMRFLNGAVNTTKGTVKSLDSYNKFALHLYMAGAVDFLCDFRKLGAAGKSKLTAVALETLGTKGDIAAKFHDKLDEYLKEPRYLGVVQAGREAMGDFMLGDEANAHYRIKPMMEEWNRPAEKKSAVITVMFTDMVGSTDITQARGDAAAQDIVRRHNHIVRAALAQYSGREIKHTGDGIMASFFSAADAVDATINIQRQVAAMNARTPDLGLHLRVGLNAGEPIHEEDDLFGATVQLAARVCAATHSDQTLCTASVKDLANRPALRPVGEHNLKGFRDPVPLFEIPWNE